MFQIFDAVVFTTTIYVENLSFLVTHFFFLGGGGDILFFQIFTLKNGFLTIFAEIVFLYEWKYFKNITWKG